MKKRAKKAKKQWHQNYPTYRVALSLAKYLIKTNLVGDQWEPDPLSSHLVKPLARAMKRRSPR